MHVCTHVHMNTAYSLNVHKHTGAHTPAFSPFGFFKGRGPIVGDVITKFADCL